MTGHACPECGGRRPGCACARAERAAAEDFDPLRIRPYVTLEAHDVQDLPGGAGDPPTARLAAIRPDPAPGGTGAAHGGHEGYGTAYGTQATYAPGAGASYDAGVPYDSTAPYDSGVPYDSGAPAPYGYDGGGPETAPLLLDGTGGEAPGRERTRRRRGALVAGVAAAAVVGTAALAAAVFGGEEPEDRAAVPEVTTSASLNLAVSEAPSPSSSSPTPTRSPSATPSRRTASPSPTASPTASAEPTATGSPTATGGTGPTGGASTAATPTPGRTTAPVAPVAPTRTDAPPGAILQMGDRGAKVRDLQRRLTDAYVYWGRIDGVYDEDVWEAVARYQSWMGIQGDPQGVYGPRTRDRLEGNDQH
ncbi:peptidoglycan-binding domain-containing protein [Streptomyces termitum]|uniref:peptidoglycan-binding domain-containing protein n=1 Tax=Streptomyces termitum TaxID=67368 RepID=UPI0033BCE4A1